MRKAWRRLREQELGAQLVEFALILTFVLLPLLLGILNFGYVFGQQLSLNQAAREGARKAVVAGDATTTDVGDFVRSATGGLIPSGDDITVTSNTQQQLATTPVTFSVDDSGEPTFPNTDVTCSTSGYTRLGGQLQVNASYPAKWLVPSFIPLSPPTLSATAVFRCEVI